MSIRNVGSTHLTLPHLTLPRCAEKLASEEAGMRAAAVTDRATAQASLPGISFTVQVTPGMLIILSACPRYAPCARYLFPAPTNHSQSLERQSPYL